MNLARPPSPTQRILDAETRFSALMEGFPDGYGLIQLIFDDQDRPVDYRFLEVNPAFTEQTGLKDPLGRTAREMVPDLDESWFRLYGEVALTGKPAHFENHAPALERWFEVSAVRAGRPELRQVALFFRNVTERKRAEARLAESEARFRNMADHAPVMLWVTDKKGDCEYLNRRWYEFTGQCEATALGLGWLEAVHPDDAERARDIFLGATRTASAFQVEYRLRRHDGVYRWAVDAASPRFGPHDEFLGYIGSVFDITERKQEAERRERLLELEHEARAAAEESSRLKDEFLATVSHELRTPLAAILGWVHVLKEREGSREILARGLKSIEWNAQAQSHLIEDLLDIHQMVAGQLRLDLGACDIGRVVADTLESVRPAAAARGITLTQMPGDCCTVMGDAGRLRQVFSNLVGNALKFTPEGGEVRVHARSEGGWAVVTVVDTGRGIPADVLPHIFDRFRQAQASPDWNEGGLGLGLAIVKELVEAHGGSVQAFSDGEGTGATLEVRLPLVEGESTTTPSGASPVGGR